MAFTKMNGDFREKMRRSRRGCLQIFLLISVLGILSSELGCAGYPDKYPSHLQKIERRPNTFQMVVIEPFGLFAPKERIKEIRVYEMDAKRTEIQRLWWEVVATSPVLAEGFEVHAGQVPQDFMQIFPPPDQTFKPIPGRVYEMAVTMAHPLAQPLGQGTSWIAD